MWWFHSQEMTHCVEVASATPLSSMPLFPLLEKLMQECERFVV